MNQVAVLPMPIALAQDISRLRDSIQADGIMHTRSSSPSSSSWCFDLRTILLRADLISTVARTFWNQFGEHWPFQVCGLELAAVPLITAITLEGQARGHNVNGFIVRRERKSYGSGRLVEGNISNCPVICVDDLLNTGSSMEKIARVLGGHPAKLEAVFVIIDFESERGVQWRQRRGVPIVSMFALSNFGLSLPRRNQLPALRNSFEIAWHFQPQRQLKSYHIAQKSTPAVGDGKVFFGTENGTMYALDTDSGAVSWAFTVATSHKKGIWSAPLLVDGRLFFGAYDGNLYCLDASSGKELWKSALAEWIGSSACYDGSRNCLYIGLEFELPNQRGALAAVTSDDGSLLWSCPVTAYQHGSPTFAADMGCVYFGSNDGSFCCVGAGTGEQIWTFSAGSAIRGAPEFSVERNVVVVGTAAGDVFALDASHGTKTFHWKTHGEVYSKPLIVQDRCFVSCADKILYVFDLNSGVVVKKISLGSRSFTSPSLIEGSVFVGTASGAIAEIDSISLEIIGAVQLLDCVTGSICFDPKSAIFYALCNAGEIYGFRRTLQTQDGSSRPSSPRTESQISSFPPHSAESKECLAPTQMFSLAGRVPEIAIVAAEVSANDHLFAVERSRQARIKVQRETEFIPLRRATHNSDIAINDNELVEDTRFVGAFPILMSLLSQIAEARGGVVERAMLVRLPFGGRVYPHVDEGRYYASRDRYHLVVQTSEGASKLICGPEVVEMGLGEVWWLNNKALHSAENNSSTDRVHVIFDLAPRECI